MALQQSSVRAKSVIWTKKWPGIRVHYVLKIGLYTNRDTTAGVTTDEVPDAWFGRHIPLEQFGLRRHSERVRSRRWEVYITIGEKIQVESTNRK